MFFLISHKKVNNNDYIMKTNIFIVTIIKKFLALTLPATLILSCNSANNSDSTNQEQTTNQSKEQQNITQPPAQTPKPNVERINDKSIYTAFYSPKNKKCKVYKNKELLYNFDCNQPIRKIRAKNGKTYMATTTICDENTQQPTSPAQIFCNGTKLFEYPKNFKIADFFVDDNNKIYAIGNMYSKDFDKQPVVIIQNESTIDTLLNEQNYSGELISIYSNDVYAVCSNIDDDGVGESKIFKNNKLLYKISGNVYNLAPLKNQIYSIAYVFDDDMQMPIGQLYKNDQPIAYFAEDQRNNGYIRINGQNYQPFHDNFAILDNDIYLETTDILNDGISLTSLWKNGKRQSTFSGDQDAMPENSMFITNCLSMCGGEQDIYRVCVANDMDFSFSTFYLLKNSTIFYEFVGLTDDYCCGLAWGDF